MHCSMRPSQGVGVVYPRTCMPSTALDSLPPGGGRPPQAPLPPASALGFV